MAHILFINPAWEGLVSRKGGRYNRPWPPLDLLNCAAILRSLGHSVELADARARGIAPALLAQRAAAADYAVITSSPLDRWQCPNLDLERFTAAARGLGHGRLIVTGVHGTLFPEQMLEQTGAWALILGEPEEALAELVQSGRRQGAAGAAYLQGGRLCTGPERGPVGLAKLPLPAFDLAPPEHYAYTILGRNLALLETSRGCPHSCAFCLKRMYGKGVRFKDPRRVAREALLAASLGAENAYIFDLDFAVKKSHALAVCRELVESGAGLKWCCQARADNVDAELLSAMARAGCRLIHFGAESASGRVLDASGKGVNPEQVRQSVALAKSFGIESACFFLFGLPGETAGGRRQTARLARRIDAAYCSFHRVTPYPGTRMYERQGSTAPFSAEALEPPDPVLESAIRRAYLGFYLRPGRLAALFGRKGPRDLLEGARLLAGLMRGG